MKAGNGEFWIKGGDKLSVCFYALPDGRFGSDLFDDTKKRFISKRFITKEEYLRKLRHFIYLIKNERM